ncbi:MAG: hypothetical protein U0401_18980 [Anaerolineae bacterium]
MDTQPHPDFYAIANRNPTSTGHVAITDLHAKFSAYGDDADLYPHTFPQFDADPDTYFNANRHVESNIHAGNPDFYPNPSSTPTFTSTPTSTPTFTPSPTPTLVTPDLHPQFDADFHLDAYFNANAHPQSNPDAGNADLHPGRHHRVQRLLL